MSNYFVINAYRTETGGAQYGAPCPDRAFADVMAARMADVGRVRTHRLIIRARGGVSLDALAAALMPPRG